ncbi:MAG: hypothetical protein GY872_17260 [Roseibacillus sp.]|nr:hypothetical protein [Roseibacillus sp.]
MKKRPLEDFIPIADKGTIELTFCDLFHPNGEPKWRQMGEFLNGAEPPEKTSFLDAVEIRLEGGTIPNEEPKWRGLPEKEKPEFLKRIASALKNGKPPTPNQYYKAACWLWDAYKLSGGNIPRGVKEGRTNLRRLKIENQDLSEEELKQAHKDSGLSEEALKHAREFCNDFEGLRLDDGRISAP